MLQSSQDRSVFLEVRVPSVRGRARIERSWGGGGGGGGGVSLV